MLFAKAYFTTYKAQEAKTRTNVEKEFDEAEFSGCTTDKESNSKAENFHQIPILSPVFAVSDDVSEAQVKATVK